jgi:mannose-6-phosphate isomerase-like protein (cupin superfamily)
MARARRDKSGASGGIVARVSSSETKYRKVSARTRIPVPGGKLIEEIFGRVHTGTDAFSLAHMVAPPGWGEPAQTPAFGELTLMIRGRMRVEVDGEVVELAAGEAFWIEPDVRVRYANPYPEESEYYAVCMPAFSPELARREDE